MRGTGFCCVKMVCS